MTWSPSYDFVPRGVTIIGDAAGPAKRAVASLVLIMALQPEPLSTAAKLSGMAFVSRHIAAAIRDARLRCKRQCHR